MSHRTALLIATATVFLLYCSDGFAQLPGNGNIDWQEVWVVYPPQSPDPTNPYGWMYGNNSYTGLAYDKQNDVVYIVNPGVCRAGSITYNCPKIHAWTADSGTIATRIQHPQTYAPAGQLYCDPLVINQGFSGDQYSIYKIDLDDDGRIYAANVVAPVFGICYPGPPPDCIPEFLNQGPYQIYRWDDYEDEPYLLYKTVGSSQFDTEMTWAMWGTSFDVTGGVTDVNGQPFDSARIYASGGKFYVGYMTVNDEINVFVNDDRPNPPTLFRFGVQLKHNQPGSGISAHGIAATGPYKNSQLYMDSNFREVVLNNQNQDSSPMPQQWPMALNDPLPLSITKNSGAIKYLHDERFNRTFLICADGLPTSSNPGSPNFDTKARVVDLETAPNYQNWPPSDTPPLGNSRFNNLTGEDNYITDIDYKVWINPLTGLPHLQLFVLMSNNGIACYRSRYPFPVDMTSFQGLTTGTDINLLWHIASESDNYGFEIYRSFNRGQDWEKIGFVPGRGTTLAATEYSFSEPITDKHENIGIVQYRLKQIDYSGRYEWTSAIDVYVGSAPSSFVLNQNFPNPFNPSTKISYQLQEPGYVSLKIFSSVGDEVATLVEDSRDAGLHVVEFIASDLPSGTYIYRINVNGKMDQKKMALMK